MESYYLKLNDSITPIKSALKIQSGAVSIQTTDSKNLMIGSDTAVTVWNGSSLLFYLACVKYTGWGTSLSVTVHNNNIHGLLLVSGVLFVVWMPSTSDINVTAYGTSGTFTKSGQGSCTFGPGSSSSIYKLVRNGDAFTFTSSQSVAIAWIGAT